MDYICVYIYIYKKLGEQCRQQQQKVYNLPHLTSYCHMTKVPYILGDDNSSISMTTDQTQSADEHNEVILTTPEKA